MNMSFFKRFKMPFIRVIIFFVVVGLLAGVAQYYLQYRERYNDNSSFQIINFYKEEKNSMDAVFVGSSVCFSFYSPVFAYNSYGIKTTNYSSSGMGILSYRYAIEEIRKYQKDALIVLTITPNYEMEYLGVHFMSDYMPFSKNKVDFLVRYFTQEGESILNSIGFFVPLIEYHDRWSEMKADDFVIDDGTKGATRHKYYLSTITDASDYFVFNDIEQEIPEKMSYLLNDLLDYCDDKENNIVFLLPPRTYSEEAYGQMNSIKKLISSRGYEVLDLRDRLSDIYLNPKQDYYDIYHTNIHGSIKYTDYLANFVMNRRTCNTDRDDKWDRAVDRYFDIIDDYVLDVETNMKDRDYSLAYPVISKVEQVNDHVIVEWDNVENADGYYVYRKSDDGFKKVSDVITDNRYEDDSVDAGEYTYTVIPFRNDGGRKLYGNYDYRGISIEVKK